MKTNTDRLRDAVRKRQKDGALLSVRSAAKLLRIPQSEVLELAGDLELNVNVAMGSGNWIYEIEQKGDYTLEDLNA